MSECAGRNCTYPGCSHGYQKGIHWPRCIDRQCPGCMPEMPVIEGQVGLDLSIFRPDVK